MQLSLSRFLLPLGFSFLLIGTSVAQSCYTVGADTVTVSGELKQWHNVTLSFDGPNAKERHLFPESIC